MNNELAFPQPDVPTVYGRGMSLRDYIAIKSLKTYSDDTPELMLENAIRAYKQADAMLKARES